ncbi:FkbM family methyltransferase [Streptomyces sp. OR43]|uniref:FkbM family methyltransferase n=1 Tax=Streptomyces sp. or43 TaxID=2478957 RepID=UPI0011CE2C85|nr:FkbM family methyltransferase [Streptomyces sp. or43]TXS41850.1 FkbM family methyltransferase [Streptomyces sp. or43]
MTTEHTSTYELPNGRRITCVSPAEAKVLWAEAVDVGLYRSAADALRPGDTVLDVGANIGIVSLMFGWKVRDLRIVSVEPAPTTFSCLEANLRSHLPGAVAVRSAVADRSGEATFTYYPRSTGNSGLFADQQADDENTRVFLRNTGIPEEYIGEIVKDLHRGIGMTVPTLTVSDLIRAHDLPEVSLLKIDVERAEHLVLAGVEDAHWPLIGHIVAEVHDEAGRLRTLTDLLERHGFTVAVNQQPKLAGTDLYELAATRP